MSRILITAALPYANGAIHFGHLAGAYLPADCFARFQRLQGNEVLFVCGSDEYGIAVTMSAELAGRSPQTHVDHFHAVNQGLFQQLGIAFDHYSRTTWPGHVEAAHQYFRDLLANGYIEERDSEQLYSERDGKFLADRYVVGTCPRCGFPEARGDECTRCGASYEATDLLNPRSKLTSSPLTLRSTRHWYLKLEQFRERLTSWLAAKSWKPNVLRFAQKYVQDLKSRAITRDMTWGISLPGAAGKVLYVWFEAPIGYISATKEWAIHTGDSEAWKRFWLDPATRLVQFVGKDNIPFHAAIFPAMTMGQNQPYKLVDDLAGNEFFHLDGRQFSKSDGWYIDLADAMTRYSADQIRYVLAANAPENSDADFTWIDFQNRCNSELLGKYGNFINRTLTFIRRECSSLPQRGALQPIDEAFLADIARCTQQIRESYEAMSIRRAAQGVMELAQCANVYFDAKKPWSDAKQLATRATMETTLACCLEAIKQLALTASPIIPTAAEQVWTMLGAPGRLQDHTWDGVTALPTTCFTIQEPRLLFRRIEDAEIAAEQAKLTSKPKVPMSTPAAPLPPQAPAPTPAPAAPITIDDVRKVSLRIGRIQHAEPVPKSSKLLKLQVDIGESEPRTIVAGVALKFRPEELVGKHAVVVANLAPAKLMGVESQGMLLVASGGEGQAETWSLLECPNLPPGSTIS